MSIGLDFKSFIFGGCNCMGTIWGGCDPLHVVGKETDLQNITMQFTPPLVKILEYNFRLTRIILDADNLSGGLVPFLQHVMDHTHPILFPYSCTPQK